MYALTQVRNTLFPAKSYWLSADDLYLGGSYRALWDNFIKEIQGAGIRLTDRPDALLWSHNNSHGSLSARAAYDCIVGAHSSPPVTLVDSVLWNRNLPSKISCFIWLTLRDKILTWVNLQKKGIHGPGICVLCDSNEETVEHLFIFCSVWRTVAVHVCDLLNLCTISPAASIEVMINNWIKNLPRNSPLLFLPLHMMWIIWKARNESYLMEEKRSVYFLIQQVISTVRGLSPCAVKKKRSERIIGRASVMYYPCGFMDGASKCMRAGAGYCIFINETHRLEFSLGVGHGTNTKAELLSLWALLLSSQMMGSLSPMSMVIHK